MYRIAVVDDEKNIRSLISFALKEEGFEVDEYSNGEDAWNVFSRKVPDVIVLDIMMPRMNGLELCRRVKSAAPHIPVIFLSSRDNEWDRVLGLETGADDYVCKPFSMLELTARIKAAVRRLDREQPGCSSSFDIEYGPLKICEAELVCLWKDQPVKLSVTEHRILSSLASAPGTVKSRGQLMTAAFPEDSYVNERAADSHIKRIRKKIRVCDPTAEIFEAVYGLGYRLGIEA
ncbi:MAG: response regulator transcription factor [Spirochaetales bacterium]|uniref:Response regulator transcription factor n=1 Tax=Candidatus Thalassospirochaeta sargassi TaxID=3119039 RepID=A0AAJ1MM56_9SPIO|nr:response regulator transcription factor [Spirochaetales bacterium]